MKEQRRIFHSTFEVTTGNETGYYLTITEIHWNSGKIIGSYTIELENWVAECPPKEYKFYQPIFN